MGCLRRLGREALPMAWLHFAARAAASYTGRDTPGQTSTTIRFGGSPMKSFRHAPAQARVPFYDQERRALWVGSRLDRRKRSEEHTSQLQSHFNLVYPLLLEKKN